MNEKFVIRGGKPLNGSVSIGGAKNAAVAILPATILAEGVCVIENLPRIDDVTILLNIMKRLGAKIDAREDGSVSIDTSGIHTSDVRINLVKRMRASYYLVGALLGRFLSAKVYLPGDVPLGSGPLTYIKRHCRAGRRYAGRVWLPGGGRQRARGQRYLSRPGFGGRDDQHHACGGKGKGQHDHHERRQRTACCGRGELPKLYGRAHQGRRHGYH